MDDSQGMPETKITNEEITLNLIKDASSDIYLQERKKLRVAIIKALDNKDKIIKSFEDDAVTIHIDKPVDDSYVLWHFKNWMDTPKPKKIDMSVCIDSGIDCEFSDNNDFENLTGLGKLSEIFNKVHPYTFELDEDTDWYYCRPRMNHIHASPNGWDKCPIPEGFKIKQYYNWGTEVKNAFTHTHRSIDWRNVITFEVVGISEGYEL